MRAGILLLAAAVAILAAVVSRFLFDGAGEVAIESAPPAVREPARFPIATPLAAAQEPVQDSLGASRRTAIVRAAERVAPAVVSVNVLRRETVRPRTLFEEFFMGPGMSRELQGLGSGFVIDASGLVLTNEHVVRGATETVVTLADGRDFAAEIVGTDEVTDLALLRVTDPGARDLPVAPLGTSSNLVIGEWVVAIGNPFGYLLSNAEPTVTAGVVSGLGRNIIPGGARGGGYYLDMIQTDASINPGNSGGPLVNANGQVIGVNSSIISETGGNVGLGFAIPIDRARRIAESLLEERRVRRSWVGAELQPSAPNRFGRSQYVEVAAVVPGSPAARAGLRAGDVVVSVNGRAVHTPLDWEARLLDTRVGETLDVIVERTGSRSSARVLAQDLPSLTAERVSAGTDFEFITLDPAIRAEYGLQSEQGAVIVGLSPAARSLGLREGDVILELNRVRVNSAQEAASLLRRLAGRGTVRAIYERRGQLGSVSFYIG